MTLISAVKVYLKFSNFSTGKKLTSGSVIKAIQSRFEEFIRFEIEFTRNGYYFEVVETLDALTLKTYFSYVVSKIVCSPLSSHVDIIKYDLEADFQNRKLAFKAAGEYVDTLPALD